MKRLISLLLIALLLSGCGFSGNKMKDPVTFYYLRNATDANVYDEFYTDGVIGSEEREASGHGDDLEYLLTVYFRGPLNQELVSPFPLGCRILEIQHNEKELTLLLNPILSSCSDLEITLACACLAKTSLELVDVDAVRIEARNMESKLLFSRTFTRDNLFLQDDYNPPVDNTETTQ